MASKGDSTFEHRDKRGRLNATLEKLEDAPMNLIGRGRAITDSAKRALYENGTVGRTTVLKGPPAPSASATEPEGKFRARIELPGREPYEANVWQKYSGLEWQGMQTGALIECRVDPYNPKLILLCPPEPDETRTMDSATILARGTSASAKVLESKDAGKVVPGSELAAAYLEVDEGDSVVIDWKASSGGEFS